MTAANAEEIAEWCQGQIVEERDALTHAAQPGINLWCGNEVKRASVGNAVVRRNDGTFDVH